MKGRRRERMRPAQAPVAVFLRGARVGEGYRHARPEVR